MTNSEPILHTPSKYLEGIHSIMIDDKHRIRIPSEWQEYFKDNKTIKIVYTGNYGIILPQTVFDENPRNPILIIHTEDIDNSFRFLISSTFQKAYGITLEDNIYLIGKGNHIEIYFEKDKFTTTKNRALQAAVALQVELISNFKI